MFEIVKEASIEEADKLLKQVYTEKPAHWAAGLTRQHFDGGMWLVREASTHAPIGFTGWQVRDELHGDGLKKVGYYSIGIVPEFRGKGIAKAAVAHMLQEKAAEVDVVRALIHPTNEASMQLAKSLGVEIEKSASKLDAVKALLARGGAGAIGGAVGVPVVNDLYLHPGQSWFDKSQWDDKRIADFTTNALVGAAGGGAVHHGLDKGLPKMVTGGASTLLAGPYVKPLLARLPHLVDAKADALGRAPTAAPDTSSTDRLMKGGLIGGGAIGLLLAGLLGKSFLNTAQQGNAIAAQQGKGRVKVTLPTKNPEDGETQVDMPMENINLSNNLYNALGRDTRRRLRGESKERKGHFKADQARVSNLGMEMDDAGEVKRQAA